VKPVDEQIELIRRGTAQIETLPELRRKLEKSAATGKPLRVKYGIDPTGFDVHLGHTVPLRKLRQFQELGHKAVLIIGTATAQVGDPSGRDKARIGLTPEQIAVNARNYLTQIGRVVDVGRAEVRANGEWFEKFGFGDLMKLLSKMSVQRMLERDDFTKRREKGEPIYLHECLYPLMQGQDSVEIEADVELGGTEQLFNLMVGRDLQRDAGQEPQVCLTTPLLRGTDGVKKMGKTDGNYIGLSEAPQSQFDKTMSIPDDIMPEWLTLLTDLSAESVARLTDPAQTHPMEAKKLLASEIVSFYHGPDAAGPTRAEWERRFSHKQDPSEIEETTVARTELTDGKVGVVRLLALTGLVKSSNEARRLFGQEGKKSGVNIGPDRTPIEDPTAQVEVTDGLIVRKGRHVRRVRIS
jgi:tyrosyl-tRNA synthetase